MECSSSGRMPDNKNNHEPWLFHPVLCLSASHQGTGNLSLPRIVGLASLQVTVLASLPLCLGQMKYTHFLFNLHFQEPLWHIPIERLLNSVICWSIFEKGELTEMDTALRVVVHSRVDQMVSSSHTFFLSPPVGRSLRVQMLHLWAELLVIFALCLDFSKREHQAGKATRAVASN